MTPSKHLLDDLLTDRPGDKRVAFEPSPSPASLSASLSHSQEDRGITFPTFLTLMGEHLYDFDTESELLAAFECFDEGDTGVVRGEEMRRWLMDVGEKMDAREVRLVHFFLNPRWCEGWCEDVDVAY